MSAATDLADEIDAVPFTSIYRAIVSADAAALLRASELPPARWILGEGVELEPGHAIIAGRVVALPPVPASDDFPCCSPCERCRWDRGFGAREPIGPHTCHEKREA